MKQFREPRANAMRLMQISFSLDCKLREISVSFQHTAEKEMKGR